MFLWYSIDTLMQAQFDDNTRAIVMFPIETFWGRRRNNKDSFHLKNETIWRIKNHFNMYQFLSKRTSLN
jgi:hypothetical protein